MSAEPDYDREGAALAAVAMPETGEIAPGMVMRPLTSGSAALCSLAGNRTYSALVGEEPKLGDLTDYDLLEFVYIHTAPLPEVRRAVCAVGDTLRDKALVFGDTLDFGVILGARKALETVKAQLAALGVDVEAKPLPHGAKEDTPQGKS